MPLTCGQYFEIISLGRWRHRDSRACWLARQAYFMETHCPNKQSWPHPTWLRLTSGFYMLAREHIYTFICLHTDMHTVHTWVWVLLFESTMKKVLDCLTDLFSQWKCVRLGQGFATLTWCTHAVYADCITKLWMHPLRAMTTTRPLQPVRQDDCLPPPSTSPLLYQPLVPGNPLSSGVNPCIPVNFLWAWYS